MVDKLGPLREGDDLVATCRTSGGEEDALYYVQDVVQSNPWQVGIPLKWDSFCRSCSVSRKFCLHQTTHLHLSGFGCTVISTLLRVWLCSNLYTYCGFDCTVISTLLRVWLCSNLYAFAGLTVQQSLHYCGFDCAIISTLLRVWLYSTVISTLLQILTKGWNNICYKTAKKIFATINRWWTANLLYHYHTSGVYCNTLKALCQFAEKWNCSSGGLCGPKGAPFLPIERGRGRRRFMSWGP